VVIFRCKFLVWQCAVLASREKFVALSLSLPPSSILTSLCLFHFLSTSLIFTLSLHQPPSLTSCLSLSPSVVRTEVRQPLGCQQCFENPGGLGQFCLFVRECGLELLQLFGLEQQCTSIAPWPIATASQ